MLWMWYAISLTWKMVWSNFSSFSLQWLSCISGRPIWEDKDSSASHGGSFLSRLFPDRKRTSGNDTTTFLVSFPYWGEGGWE